ncbi:MAG: hypothetical protein FD169_689 [Bacillota bacterium]|nr:MAG: hypothetical protein FD169_689 [Bacillota bacterium]MBS3949367.1 DUF2922 domain-containing protein [Peptococcaceae bacterium]
MNKTLQMVFVNEAGGNVTISVQDPHEALAEQAVVDVMTLIIEKDIFVSNGGSLISIHSARIVSRDVEPIIG